MNELIKKYPVGQKRQTYYKQFVFIIDEKHVYKGPYEILQHDCITKITSIETRTKYFEKININNIITLPLEKRIIYGQTYFVFANLYGKKPEQLSSIDHIESFDEKYEYKLINDDTLISIDIAVKKYFADIEKVAIEYITMLIILWIFGVGDIVMRNSLFNTETKQIHIIDFEDDRNKILINKREFFYFSKTEPEFEEIFRPLIKYNINAIINIIKEKKQLMPETIMVKGVLINIYDRISTAIDFLQEKY